jgi:hydroxypyruvate isomerase
VAETIRIRNALTRWRHRLAYAVARRMTRIHPRMHVIVVSAPPGLSDKTISACVTAGLRHAARMMAIEAETVRIDRWLGRVHPEFFGDDAADNQADRSPT